MKKPFFDKVAAVFSRMLAAFFVNKCAVCSEVLWGKGELCEECLSLWEKARLERCPVCAKTARFCRCRPISLTSTGRIGDKYITSLVFYGKSGDTRISTVLVRKLINKLKKSGDRSCVRFVSRELSVQILRLLKTQGEDISEWRICYPPRSKKNIKKFGFDQAKEIAKTVSRYTGIESEDCLRRKGHKMQKTLNPIERRKNAENSYFLSKDAVPENKKYIIIDDVITTGATVNASAKLLLDAGAQTVYPVSVARTKKKKRKVSRRVSEKLWFK